MNARKRIPCCFFPTTPLLVDDEQAYLEGLGLRLHNIPKPYTYTNPYIALDFIENEYHSLFSDRKWQTYLKGISSNTEEFGHPTHSILDFNIFSTYQLIYQPDRFKELAVTIADYSMPELNGVDLFSRMTAYPFQKILLTGHATHSIGVEAFNKGLINQFIEKDLSLNFDERINAVFKALEYQYFVKLSENITHKLIKSSRSCFGEPVFLELFHETIQKNNIVEYYLVHESGCFLMLDFEGHPSWFVVKSEDDMQYYYQSAIDNEAPGVVIDKLKSKNHLLFLFSKTDDEDVTYDAWVDYLHVCKNFVGEKNTFYVSYLKDKSIYDKQLGQYSSYRDYLMK